VAITVDKKHTVVKSTAGAHYVYKINLCLVTFKTIPGIR